MAQQFNLPFPNYMRYTNPRYKPLFFKDLKRLNKVLRGNILINQTYFFLTDLDKELLSLGLNFIPTLDVSPSVFPNSSDDSFTSWTRIIDDSFYFSEDNSAAQNGWLDAVIPNSWSPSSSSWMRDSDVLQAAEKLKESLTPYDSPIAKQVRTAITRLGSTLEIQILKADKGRGVVMWQTSDYDKEAFRHLSNPKSYDRLPLDTYRARLDTLVSDCKDYAVTLFNLGCLTKCELDSFANLQPGNGSAFYLLPKIHKDANILGSFSGQPIVATFSNPVHLLDKYLGNLTALLLRLIPGSLVDTPNLLAHISTLPPLTEKAVVVTADVTCLYPNIPWEQGIEASAFVYNKFLPELRKYAIENNLPPPPSLTLFVDLLAFVLKSSYIHFKIEFFYQQKTGIAMGMCVANFFANAYMYFISKNIIDNPPLGVRVFLRFVDDIIVILDKATEESVKLLFLSITNDFVKYSISPLHFEQNFLDVMVSITRDTYRVQSSPLWKSTDYYLNRGPHSVNALPCSQFLRLQSISSTPEIFKTAAKHLVRDISRSGYKRKYVQAACQRAEKSKGSTSTKKKRNSKLKRKTPFSDRTVNYSDCHLALTDPHYAVSQHYEVSSPRCATFLSVNLSSLLFCSNQNLHSFCTYNVQKGVRR